MDVRNYCVECDMPKPCDCDLLDYEFDTTDYVILHDGIRRIIDKQLDKE